ncbi:MAG: hypothetical protein OXG82_21990 [Gammaproteobacteria bacterium]|nr:hypothetical protein [Gammaproteobacteria bacterium]
MLFIAFAPAVPGAEGTDERRQGASKVGEATDAAARSWSWLAGQVGWSDASALRHHLAGVSTTDIEWVRVTMHSDRRFLEQPGITAEWMLADPGHQVVRKAVGGAAAIGLAGLAGDTAALARLALDIGQGDPALKALDAALWNAYGSHLGEYVWIRDESGAGTTMFLWVRYAARVDRDALETLRVSAHDLLQMADYQLARKLAADAHVQSLVECVRCATPSAPYYDDCGTTEPSAGEREGSAPRKKIGHCALSSADDPTEFCAAYLPRMLHPATQLAHCPDVAANLPKVPEGSD